MNEFRRTISRGDVNELPIRRYEGEIVRKKLGKASAAVETVRGFRIVSGGLLRPLENYRWWWRFNRRLGELLPAACIEAQIIARKIGVFR